MNAAFETRFHELARECGFALSGIAPVEPGLDFERYQAWGDADCAGPLHYLTDHRAGLRRDPRTLLASARSVLCLGLLYNTRCDTERDANKGVISRYAWGELDYHDVLRERMEQLAERMQQEFGAFDYRACVDTAPLLERSYAQRAGLGWIGRNTCLINQPRGSWFFLGEILTSLELAPNEPAPNRCGTCRRCIDACPTRALVEDGAGGWRLDAARCISTVTIEQRGPTDVALRASTANLVFGCDICQEVCPWNRHAPVTGDAAFQPRHATLDLEGVATMGTDAFRARFRQTPLWRTKYVGLLRNVATAMGNSRQTRYGKALTALTESDDAGVAEHARWALAQLEDAP